MLDVSDALALVLRHAQPLPPRLGALGPELLGRVLAEDVAADLDSPPYTKALMDGYAVRTADCASAPVTLRVVDEVVAGRVPSRPVGSGEATRIMTGAPMPAGADCVVPVEQTEAAGETVRLVGKPPRSQQNVLERGREMRVGEVVLPAGAVLRPQELGVLAAVGRASVRTHGSPRVAVMTTGDEVVEPGQRPGPGQIRNSNGTMLLAQAARAGAAPHYLGIARDAAESLRVMIGGGLSSADVLILSGGVSAGKLDLVPGVLQELGVQPHFHKVRLKPGKPLFFGTRGGTLVFGLPGNPVSSFVCFELFIRPAIRRLCGDSATGPTRVTLPVAGDFTADNDRPTFHPARTEFGDGGLCLRPLPWFGSADLRGIGGADALLELAPGAVSLRGGDTVNAVLLNA